jgi:hypothetical protein
MDVGQTITTVVRGESVTIDVEKMMQLIDKGVDAHTALLQSIVGAPPGGKVCQLVGINQYNQLVTDVNGDERKAQEILKQRNPQGYECIFGAIPEDQAQQPRPRDAVDMIQEDPGSKPLQVMTLDALVGIVKRVDLRKAQEYDAKVRPLVGKITLNEAMDIAEEMIGPERFREEMDKS